MLKDYIERFKKEKSIVQALKVASLIFGLVILCFIGLPSLVSKDFTVTSYAYEELFLWEEGVIVPAIWAFFGYLFILVSGIYGFVFFKRRDYVISFFLSAIGFILICTQPVMTLSHYYQIDPTMTFNYGLGITLPFTFSLFQTICFVYLFLSFPKVKKDKKK